MNPPRPQFLIQTETLQKNLPVKDQTANERQIKLSTQNIMPKYNDQKFQYPKSHKDLTIKVVKLDEFNLEDVTTLLTKNIISVNKVWKHFNLPYDEVRVSIRGKLIPAINQSFVMNFQHFKVILVNDVVAGAFLQFDIYDYLKLPSMPNHLKFFDHIGKLGQHLETVFNSQLIKKRGITSYGIFGVIDEKYSKLGLSQMFWWRCFSELKLYGYKNYYARVSSEVPLKMLMRLGAKIVSEGVIQSGEMKQKIWMIQMDLSKPFPTYKQFKQIRAKYQSIKPKL